MLRSAVIRLLFYKSVFYVAQPLFKIGNVKTAFTFKPNAVIGVIAENIHKVGGKAVIYATGHGFSVARFLISAEVSPRFAGPSGLPVFC